MSHELLYLGDTSLTGAAAYLAGMLAVDGREFDYVPSHVPLAESTVLARRLFIISDYPAARLTERQQHQIAQHVQSGAGLLVIGGWESFQGNGGGWHAAALAELLPVVIGDTDDRVNADSPVFLMAHGEHPVIAGLPWKTRPPLIGGYNRVRTRSDGELLLSACRYRASVGEEGIELSEVETDPLLVVSAAGAGRVAALMTDLAPHWVGPLVDWGDDRVPARAPGAEEVEVGSLYARFVRQLVGWCCGE